MRDIKELASSCLDAIRLSDGVLEAVTVWFESKFPQRLLGGEHENDIMQGVLENIMQVLVDVGESIRPAMKMARVGVFAKIFVSVSLTYSDIISDILVTKSYYERGMMTWFRMSAALIITALVVQFAFVYFQYRPGGYKRWVPRVLASILGLSHLLEGYLVWSGSVHQTEETLFKGVVAMGMLKAMS